MQHTNPHHQHPHPEYQVATPEHPPTHVVKVVSIKQDRQFKALMVVGAFLAVVGLYAIFLGVSSQSHAAGAQDCDDNAVIMCGAQTKAELQQKIAEPKNKVIFDKFDIHASDVPSMVPMTVFKDGHVTVGGKTVARDVMSVGRQFIPGSTAINGVWERPPEVSFLNNSLTGWALMKNGVFQFGILSSCGNPIIPTHVVQPKPTTVTIPVNVHANASSTVACPDGTQKQTVTVTGPNVSGKVEATAATHDEAVTKARALIAAKIKDLTPRARQLASDADHQKQQDISKTLTSKCAAPPVNTPPSVSTPLPTAGPEFAIGGGAVASALSIMGYAYQASKRRMKEALLSKLS